MIIILSFLAASTGLLNHFCDRGDEYVVSLRRGMREWWVGDSLPFTHNDNIVVQF